MRFKASESENSDRCDLACGGNGVVRHVRLDKVAIVYVGWTFDARESHFWPTCEAFPKMIIWDWRFALS